jgi:hypothetical protein
MITTTQDLSVGAGKRAASRRSIGRLWRSIREGTSMWARTGADYFAAAGAYEDLSRLSDQELQRRGLSRTTLARDVCRAFDSSEPATGDAAARAARAHG